MLCLNNKQNSLSRSLENTTAAADALQWANKPARKFFRTMKCFKICAYNFAPIRRWGLFK